MYIHLCTTTLAAWRQAPSTSAAPIYIYIYTFRDVGHDFFICVTWLVHMCNMPHSYVRHDCRNTYMRHDSFTYRNEGRVTRYIHVYVGVMLHIYIGVMLHISRESWLDIYDISSHASLISVCAPSTCETWPLHMCDMTLSYVGCVLFICGTKLIHMCNMTCSYVWHDSSATWLIQYIRATRLMHIQRGGVHASTHSRTLHMCDMTPSYVRHDSFICATWLIHIPERGARDSTFVALSRLIHMRDMIRILQICDMTHSHTKAWGACLDTRAHYGVALVSRIDKFIGLFCKRALWNRRYSAKETYNLIEPTDRSHPISTHMYRRSGVCVCVCVCVCVTRVFMYIHTRKVGCVCVMRYRYMYQYV